MEEEKIDEATKELLKNQEIAVERANEAESSSKKEQKPNSKKGLIIGISVFLLFILLLIIFWPRRVPRSLYLPVPYVFNSKYFHILNKYSTSKGHSQVLVVTGPKGIGKARGLREYIDNTNKSKFTPIYIDFQSFSPQMTLLDFTSYLFDSFVAALKSIDGLISINQTILSQQIPFLGSIPSQCPKSVSSTLKDQSLVKLADLAYGILSHKNTSLTTIDSNDTNETESAAKEAQKNKGWSWWQSNTPQTEAKKPLTRKEKRKIKPSVDMTYEVFNFFEFLDKTTLFLNTILFINDPSNIINSCDDREVNLAVSGFVKFLKNYEQGNYQLPTIMTVTNILSNNVKFIRRNPSSFRIFFVGEMEEEKARDILVVKEKVFTKSFFKDLWKTFGGFGEHIVILHDMLREKMSIGEVNSMLTKHYAQRITTLIYQNANKQLSRDRINFLNILNKKGKVSMNEFEDQSRFFLDHGIVKILDDGKVNINDRDIKVVPANKVISHAIKPALKLTYK